MSKYTSIKIDTEEQFNFLQNHFSKEGYFWIASDNNYIDYEKKYAAVLIDYEHKKLATFHDTTEWIYGNLIIKKAIDYKIFVRQFKLNKIND